MRYIIILLFSTIPFLAVSQPDKEKILEPIKNLFDAMRAGDSTMVKNCFHPEATMYTTYVNKHGQNTLRAGSVDQFAQAVGSPHDEIWDEKIWTYRVEKEDLLATVWTEYTFYAGDKMSHCGVNAFQLFDSGSGWKILHITDTRKSKDCQTE